VQLYNCSPTANQQIVTCGCGMWLWHVVVVSTIVVFTSAYGPIDQPMAIFIRMQSVCTLLCGTGMFWFHFGDSVVELEMVYAATGSCSAATNSRWGSFSPPLSGFNSRLSSSASSRYLSSSLSFGPLHVDSLGLGLRPDWGWGELVVDASLVACPDLPRKSSACLGFGYWYNVVLGVFCESVSV
jgi:hypothetical protein